MKKLLAIMAATVVLLVSACSQNQQGPAAGETTLSGDSAVLDRLGLAGMSGQQIVEKLDKSAQARPLSHTASVRPNAVVLADEKGQVSVPLPADKFYLSVAPYVTRTHDCFFHSLATCNGELKDAKVKVTIKTEDGTTLVEEDATTYAGNGFIGYWVPRNAKGTVTITDADGRTGTVNWASGSEDATCLTTLRLQ